MTRSYAFSRKDANHDELAAVYVELGCSCEDTSSVGVGFPDAIVGAAGVTDLVEFKTEKGKLEPAQETFHARWRGSRVWIVRTRSEVVLHVQNMRQRARKLGGLWGGL
jgi:hypothetical protein